MDNSNYTKGRILGLDIGANSVGWALLGLEEGKPNSIVDIGVRIFEAGVEMDEGGKSESRNAERRAARSRRRLIARRVMRLKSVLKILQGADFLPEGDPLAKSGPLAEALRPDPYGLRAEALDRRLTPHELGRVLYHLAHRRGFLSNRKSEPKDDDEAGLVAESTSKLDDEMRESGARTLGEFLNGIDRHETRIRERYTLRKWYLEEFEKIWSRQQQENPQSLTDELKKRIHRAIFYQRPLKSVKDLIGYCELEPKRRRAPMALLAEQRRRYLQDVNHTRVAQRGMERRLTEEERAKLIELLESKAKLTFAGARRLLKLPKEAAFNLQRGGKEEFIGNRTTAKLISLFGDAWSNFSDDQQDQIVEDLLSIEKEEAAVRRGMSAWGLDPEGAEKFAQLKLEPGYSALSRAAIDKLAPHLEKGLSYTEAVNAAYPDGDQSKAVDKLPPLPDLRNPIVQRALAEVRKIVNRLVAKHGRPEKIRIELARDLKNTAKRREEIGKQNRANERDRKRAAARIADERGIENPKRSDTEKVLLAEECQWICPYTGQGFSIRDLFGDGPTVDIEHIVPFSRSLDNSFMNKTLCLVKENRDVKGAQTPFEAYGADEDRYEAILTRVRKFSGNGRQPKLRRFLMREVRDEQSFMEEFSSQQLNDTRYASRKAAEYLGQFYGPQWRSHVEPTKGQVTAYFRGVWDLNPILSSGPFKSRDDHRHHAIDAIVTALSDPGAIHALSTASKYGKRAGRFGPVQAPWPGFGQEVRQAIEGIVVSHRTDRRVNGPLHKETFYGLIRDGRGGAYRAVVRKKLGALTEPDIRKDRIVDRAVREAVRSRLAQIDPDLKKALKAFSDRSNHPVMRTKEGREIPVHKVRVFQSVNPTKVAKDNPARTRNVQLGANHHVEVFEATDKQGHPTWSTEVISQLEAKTRLRRGEPVVARSDREGRPLLFSLGHREAVELDWKGERVLCVVQKFSFSGNPYYVFKRHNDARKDKDRKADEIRFQSDKSLYGSGLRKRLVTPVGEIRDAND